MALTDELLIFLSAPYPSVGRALRMPSEIYSATGIARNFPDKDAHHIRTTLSRLKSRGYVENNRGIWKITRRALVYLSDELHFHKKHESILRHHAKKMIIAFDIPEKRKRARQWLRYELRQLEFKFLQKSLWIGPYPLPSDFVKVLRTAGLLQYIRFFEAREADLI